MTHLNPMANNLEAFSNDILKLLSGKVIKKDIMIIQKVK